MPAQPFSRLAPDASGVSITPLGTFDIPADPNGLGRYTPLTVLVPPAILGFLGNIQSVWVDAASAKDPVTVRNVQTRQYKTWPAGSAGWQSLLAKSDANLLELYCFSAVTIAMDVANVALPTDIFEANVVKSSPYAEVTRVTASAADKAILAADAERQGFSLFNDSTATLRALISSQSGAASTTNYTVQIPPLGYFESPFKCGAPVRGIWTAANGAALVTEYF